jgi:hypothetical protein
MPRIRLLRGVVVQGRGRDPGEVLEVTDAEARLLVDVYRDAERVGEDEIRIAVPEVEHRDPVIRKRK